MAKVGIGKAAEILGVSVRTLYRWEKSGKLVPEYTPSGQRRYDEATLRGQINVESDKKTIAYARVSSLDQRNDLERQITVLKSYCTQAGWNFEVIQDLGSGMNYQKKGLIKLLRLICDGQVQRLVLTHKDRLLRFGAELVFRLCEIFGTEVVLINHKHDTTFEEDLATDVLEIITVFSARLYGSRSHKNKKIVQQFQEVAQQLSTEHND